MSQVLRTRSPDDMQAAQTIAAESVKSLSNQAYERILDMMLSGELPVGTILQERRIAEALSISRTPTRSKASATCRSTSLRAAIRRARSRRRSTAGRR